MIDPTHPVISITRQCELIQLPRGSYYRAVDYGPVVETEENLSLMRLIDEEYTRHPFYGSRQLRNYLCRQGHKVNRKRVQRLMRLMGIMSVAPKPNTSKKGKAHKIYPYLLKNLVIDKPNRKRLINPIF